jgi:hypothetical protein
LAARCNGAAASETCGTDEGPCAAASVADVSGAAFIDVLFEVALTRGELAGADPLFEKRCGAPEVVTSGVDDDDDDGCGDTAVEAGVDGLVVCCGAVVLDVVPLGGLDVG